MSSQTETPPAEPRPEAKPAKLDRRTLLVGAGVAAVCALGYPLVRRLTATPKPVFVARNQRYDGPLAQTIREGLATLGFDAAWVRARRVLLKPNLVEPTRASPQMTTHPAVVQAVVEVFRDWGAEVTIGEAPGHVRDTELALVESGLDAVLQDEKLPFADLNYSQTQAVVNRGRTSALEHFYFPREVIEADLIVSIPKLKTHHWVGFTASMKNLYGTLPGVIYGWPKNVLHYAGIPQTVVDINASLPPAIGVVDAITCMEGDGPIMGTAKPMGLLGIGLNLPALDATLARIIGLEPKRVPYLRLASRRLGPISDWEIVQRGEPWQELRSPLRVIEVEHLQAMRGDA